MAFNDRLKYERELRGWSQAKLAEMLGVTPSRVSTWERSLGLPSPYVRQQLFTLLNKNASELELLTDMSSENDGLSASVSHQNPQLTPVSSNRQRLLTRVHMFWIKDVLDRSLYNASLITPELHGIPRAVEHPWHGTIQQYDAHLWPPGSHITQVYEEAGNELLLLGEPGSGKTTLLLELARYLLEQATQSETCPIPVVFHLASWSEKRLPITSWLIEELQHKYQVPRKLGSAWIQADQVLPLLDGLDEVAIAYRTACVEAINVYREEHGLVPMVVCSRRDDYLPLKKRLLLHRAVLIAPFNDEQIEVYLSNMDEHAAAMRQVLHNDANLHKLATTPLMLSILVQVYSEQANQYPLIADTPEAQREQLFTIYVQRMLQRRGSSSSYTEQQTMHWLIWLAKQGKRHHQPEVYIERIQPNWLPTDRWQWTYTLIARGVSGLLFGLTNGLVLGMLFQWIRGDLLSVQFFCWMQIFSLISGLLFGLTGRKGIKAEKDSDARRQGVNWRQGLRACGAFLVVFGGGSALFFSVQLAQQRGWMIGLIAGLLVGLMCGLSSALISGILAISGLIWRLEGTIQPAETITWSWVGVKRDLPTSLRKTLLLGLLPGLLAGSIVGVIQGMLNGLVTLLGIELMIGGVGGLLVGVAAGFSKDLLPQHRLLKPNEGIRRSMRYSLLFGASASVLVGGSIWLIVVLLSVLTIILGLAHPGPGSTWFVPLVIERFPFAILPGLFAGLVSGLINGGEASIQHAILRLLLWRSGSAPLDYPRFLDYAVERLLLRKLGGGYIFIHKLLLDHLASLE